MATHMVNDDTYVGGTPRTLVVLLSEFGRRLKRAMKIGKHFGSWRFSTNSLAQGNALSLRMANMLSTVWRRALAVITPAVKKGHGLC